MKKFLFFIIIMGTVLCLVPEFAIVADITSVMLGKLLWAVAGVIVCGILLYRFQQCCDEIAAKMHEEREQALKEQNTEIIYPTVREVLELMTRFLPRLLGAIVIATAAYLALSFSWHYILPVLKYAAYAAGVCFAVLLVICAMPVKSDDSCETA